MIVDEHIWLYFNYVRLAVNRPQYITTMTVECVRSVRTWKMSDTPNYFVIIIIINRWLRQWTKKNLKKKSGASVFDAHLTDICIISTYY